MLQVGERELVRELAARRWTYRRPGNRKPLIAHAEILARGLLVHKVRVLEQPDGFEKVREQVLVTPKKLARLAEIFASSRTAPAALPA